MTAAIAPHGGRPGIGDQVERLLGAAGADHHNRSVVQHAGENILVDLDRFHLGHVDLDGAAGNEAHLDNHPLVGDGELAGPLPDPGRGKHHHPDGQEDGTGIGHAQHAKGDAANHEGRRRQEDDGVNSGLIHNLLPRNQVGMNIISHLAPAAIRLPVLTGPASSAAPACARLPSRPGGGAAPDAAPRQNARSFWRGLRLPGCGGHE